MQILISFLIFSTICWLFRNVLFSLHVCIFNSFFFPISSVQSLSRVWLFATPWISARHASLSITISQTHIHQVSDAIQPSHPLLSPSPPAPNPSQHHSLFQWVRSAWGGQSTGASALASFLPKKSQGWSPSEWTGWISLQSKGLLRVFNTTLQKHQFFGVQLSLQSNSHIHTRPLEKPYPWLDRPLLAK